MRRLLILAAAVALWAPGPASAEEQKCRAARGAVNIELGAGYTAADVAAWWAATRCVRVVLPPSVATRSSRRGVTSRVPARRLRGALDRILARLDLVAVGKAPVVVFVDDKAARGGPGVFRPRGTPAGAAGRPAPRARPGDDAELRRAIRDGVREKSPRHRVLDRALLDRILANPAALARSARVIPSIKDGKPNGFKLYGIRPGSFPAALGFRNGDTITAVNGMDLTTPDKALEIFAKLREARRLLVAVTRRGKPIRLRIDIR